jgi:hypothetical protein
VHPRLKLLAVLLLFSTTTFAAEADVAQAQTKKKKISPEADIQQFIHLVIRKGRDWTLFADQRGPLFGFPNEGVPSKALAQNGAPDESGNPAHMCNVVLESNTSEGKPVCLVLQTTVEFPDQKKNKDWYFRFGLDGSLEKAATAVGQLDENGDFVAHSGTRTPQDIRDPDVQALAQKELKFWLKAAYAMMRLDSESAKRTAATSNSSDSKSSKSSPQSVLDEIH